jgi:hypothetical protein
MERMTSSGRRLAFFVGIVLAFALPKHVDCGYPGGTCGGGRCTYYEVEPWGFYLLENLLGRDIGFAYTSDYDCHGR